MYMKYLKRYNEGFKYSINGLSQDILNDLYDICLDIKDIGCFQIHYSHFEAPELYRYPSDDSIMIDTTNPKDGASIIRYFLYDEISETIERIKDYMNQQGYDINVRLNGYDSKLSRNKTSDRLFECRIFFIKRKENEIFKTYI